MKEGELPVAGRGSAPLVLVKHSASKKKGVAGTVASLCLITVLLIVALLFFRCGHVFHLNDELAQAEHVVSEAAHHLVRRDCNDTTTAVTFESTAAAVSAGSVGASETTITIATTSAGLGTAFSASSFVSGASLSLPTSSLGKMAGGVSIPISTETALSTLYSISTTPNVTALTTTTTQFTTVFVTPPGSSSSTSSLSENGCGAFGGTTTVSVTITVVPTPSAEGSTSTLTNATVTGAASTVTNVQTDVSYTSGLPGATVSGNPSTVTALQTDVSYTSGLPAATASGNPSTVTDVLTSYSLTSSLSDATVFGTPNTVTDVDTSYSGPLTTIVITDLWGTSTPGLSTVTTVVTAKTTITTEVTQPEANTVATDTSLVTVVISDLYPTPPTTSSGLFESTAAAAGASTSSPAPSSTTTFTLTTVGGPPAVSTSTVQVTVPYQAGNGSYTGVQSGTVSSEPVPTTPAVVISRGSKQSEPPAWSGGRVFSNVGSIILLVAAIMFTL